MVPRKQVTTLVTASCEGGKVVYINEKINISELPTLETVLTSKCGKTNPRSATLIDGRIVCLDKDGNMHADEK